MHCLQLAKDISYAIWYSSVSLGTVRSLASISMIGNSARTSEYLSRNIGGPNPANCLIVSQIGLVDFDQWYLLRPAITSVGFVT